MLKWYVAPAVEPGEPARPVPEHEVFEIVGKGLDPSAPVNVSVADDTDAIFWICHYSNRLDFPYEPDAKEVSRWTEGSYASKADLPADCLSFTGFGAPIPALDAFPSAFLLVACVRDQVDLARAALAAGADREAWYPRAPLEWGAKRERLLRYHGL